MGSLASDLRTEPLYDAGGHSLLAFAKKLFLAFHLSQRESLGPHQGLPDFRRAHSCLPCDLISHHPLNLSAQAKLPFSTPNHSLTLCLCPSLDFYARECRQIIPQWRLFSVKSAGHNRWTDFWPHEWVTTFSVISVRSRDLQHWGYEHKGLI